MTTNPLRKSLVEKYGGSSTSSPTSNISSDNMALEATNSPAPAKAKTSATSGNSLRAGLIDKYGTPASQKTPVTETPVSTKPVFDTGETISQAPKKNIFEKGIDFVKGLVQGDDQYKADRDAVVSAVRDTLAGSNYAEIGKQLGYDKTVKATLPGGVDPKDQTTVNYYQNKAIIDEVKKNYSQIQKEYPDLPPQEKLSIDTKTIEDNLPDFTKAIGVRSVPTVKEVVSTLATLPVVAGLMEAPIATVIGVAGWTALTKIETALTGGQEFSDVIANKIGATEPVRDILGLLELTGKGKILHGIYKAAPTVAEKFIKDTAVTYKMGENVYIDPVKVRDIFQTGKKISPEETLLIQRLGFTAEQYQTAMKNGVNISVPAEKMVSIVDKPWWGKLKETLGVKSATPNVLRVESDGKVTLGPEQRPNRLLPGGTTTSTTEPIISSSGASQKQIPQSLGGANPQITALLDAPQIKEAVSTPITPKLIDRVANFTPVESTAFGRKIIDKINETIGTKITEGQGLAIPENINLIETPSGDGRPAQFKNGQIEIFVPNLMEDLATLSKGGQLMAHDGEFTTVYEKKAGESMEELAVRYVKDVLVHEKAHEMTMTLADNTMIQNLRQNITQARLSQSPTAVIDAQQKLKKFMDTLEVKANTFARDNRGAIEKELFSPNKSKIKAPNQFERRALNIPTPNTITITEKSLLHEKMKTLARGSKEGFQAGKKTGEDKAAAEAKSKYEKIIDSVHDKYMSALQKRTQLIDYAQLLPFRERGKFLKAIRNVVTEREMLDVLARMRKEANAADRRVLISKISDELKSSKVKKVNGLPNAKFAYDQQKTLNAIRAVQKLTYQEAQIQIANKISDWQTQHPDESLPYDLLHEVEVLKTAGIKDQTVGELGDTLAMIQSIKETGRTAKETERFNRETEVQRAKDTIFEVITGGEKLPSESLSIKTRTEKRAEFFKKYARDSIFAWEELLDKLSVKDIGSKPYQSFLSTFAGEKTNASFNLQNKGETESIAKINDKLKEIYKLTENKQILVKMADLQEMHSLGKVMHNDGVARTLELSRGEAMQYHMWMQDPTLERTFEETLHWGPEVKTAVESLLTPEDRKMADALLNFYKEYYDGVNKVFSKEFGVDLPFNENYSPVHRAIDVAIPENVLLAQEVAKYASAKNGSLKERVKNQMDLKAIDAFENVTRHITKMEHYKAWSDTMFNLRRVFGDKEVRQAITDFHGDPYLKIADNFLNDMARDGVAREKISTLADTLRKNATVALLGLNIKVGLKQITGVMNYGIELPTKDFFGGLTDFWKDPLGHANFLYERSQALQERFGDGFDRDLKYAIEKGYDKKLAKTVNLSEHMFIPIRNADKITVYMGSWAAYRSAYQEAIKAGKTPDQAEEAGIRFAENVTNRVQESSRLDTLAPLQREGSWSKLLTMFQSQPSKYVRIMANTARNYKAGRQDGKTAIRRILWTWVIVPFIYNLVADQFVQKEYRESSGGLVTRTLLGPLTYPLIIGQMVQQVYGWVSGNSFDYSPSPAFAFMDDIMKTVQKFSKKQENFTTKDAVDGTTYAIDAIGKLKGVPTGIVTKPVRNVMKDNKSEPKGAAAKF